MLDWAGLGKEWSVDPHLHQWEQPWDIAARSIEDRTYGVSIQARQELPKHLLLQSGKPGCLPHLPFQCENQRWALWKFPGTGRFAEGDSHRTRFRHAQRLLGRLVEWLPTGCRRIKQVGERLDLPHATLHQEKINVFLSVGKNGNARQVRIGYLQSPWSTGMISLALYIIRIVVGLAGRRFPSETP